MVKIVKKEIVELRKYNLPENFPVLLLNSEKWRISDVPTGVFHLHNCIEIGLCCSDTGIIENQYGKYFFKKGDVTFISRNVAHTTYSTEGTQSKWCYIFVDLEELLFPYFSMILSESSVTEAFNSLNMNHFMIASEKITPHYGQLVKLMVDVLEQKKDNYQIIFRTLILSFVMSMINDKSEGLPLCENVDYSSHSQIEPALKHIKNHYQDSDLSIQLLAKLCNLSLTHFRRLFRSSVDSSPLDYLNLTRIIASQKLLSITNDNILEIAEEVGFQTISSFNRQFLKYTGTTPSKWRKNKSHISQSKMVEYVGWMEPPKEF